MEDPQRHLFDPLVDEPVILAGYPLDELRPPQKGRMRGGGPRDVVGVGRWIAPADAERVGRLADVLEARFGEDREHAASWLLDLIEGAL